MSRDKQIAEMAKDIALNMQILPNPKEHPSHQMARLLFEDGYRKASDVAREIGAILSGYNAGNYAEVTLLNKLYELKKKYESLNSWEELTHTCQVEIPHTIESIADIAFTESESEG